MGHWDVVNPEAHRVKLAKLGGVIHQRADRSWSAAVPERAPGDARFEFRGWDDPADETNGVDGREFITDLDVWVDVNEVLAPPWA